MINQQLMEGMLNSTLKWSHAIHQLLTVEIAKKVSWLIRRMKLNCSDFSLWLSDKIRKCKNSQKFFKLINLFVLYLIQCIKPSPTLTTPEFVHKGHIYSIASLNDNLIKVWKLTSKNCYFSTHFVVHSRKYISFLIELTVFLPSAALVELKPHFQP